MCSCIDVQTHAGRMCVLFDFSPELAYSSWILHTSGDVKELKNKVSP